MKTWTLLTCCFTFGALLLGQSALAGHGGHHHRCMSCAQKRCDLTVSTETEEVDCFEVECEDVCIPPVTFPWECRPSKCGRIRSVNVLTTETRERKVCEYKWDVVVICPRCRDAVRAAGCELAPGVQVLDEAVPVEEAPQAEESASTAWSAPWAPGMLRPVAAR